MTDPWETPEGVAWRERVRRELVPMIKDSAVTVQLWTDEPDAKIAVELGVTLMLGKPLIILKPSGSNVPPTLARIADAIVEYDELNADTVGRAHAEADRILRERGEL